ncbi:hypothetical protein THH46_19570 [Pseudomonas sp. NA13]
MRRKGEGGRQQKYFCFCDAHNYLASSSNPVYRRRLRDLAINIRSRGYRSNCIIIAPSFEIANDLQKEVTLIDFPLPSRDEVKAQIDNFVNSWQGNSSVKIDLSSETKDKLIDAALGLTGLEIDNSLSRSLVSSLSVDENTVKDLLFEKNKSYGKRVSWNTLTQRLILRMLEDWQLSRNGSICVANVLGRLLRSSVSEFQRVCS